MRKLSVSLGLALLMILVAAAPALAQGNIGTGLLDRFVSQTDGWWNILRGYALFLFTTTLIIEVCLFGIRVALQQNNIAEVTGQFVTLLLFAGFIAAVIMNYQEWATGVAVRGLRPLTGELTGNSVDAGQPIALAAAIIEKIMPVMEDAGITDFGEVYLYVTCMLIIMVIFVLISALVILTTCEFYIVANIGVLLIGLGGSKIFKDYAVNAMRYVLAVAVKLFVLQIIVNIGFAIISLTDLDASVGSTIDSIRFTDLFFLIGKAIILLALAKTLPETCSGIVNGSAVGGGNPLTALGRAAGTMAFGAMTAGAGYTAGAASSLKDAHTVAKAEGSGGMGGTARVLWNARNEAKAGGEQKNLDQNPGSMRNQLRSKANAVRAQRLLGDGGESAGPSSSGASGPAAQSSVQAVNSNASAAPMAADAYRQPSPSAASSNTGVSASGASSTQVPPASGHGGAGQPAPQSESAVASTAVSPQPAPAGGSGQSAPPVEAAAEIYDQPTARAAAASRPAKTPEVSAPTVNSGSGRSESQSSVPKTVKPPAPPQRRGTVDMRTYNPKKFK